MNVNIDLEDTTEAVIDDVQLFDDALFPEEIAELSAIEPSAIPLLGGAGVGSPGSAGVLPAKESLTPLSDDGSVLLGDGDGPVTTTITYYYINGQRVAQAKDGVFTWIHADHLSSATRITDVNGLEIRRLAYAAFGEEAENQGTGDDPKYTYTDKEHDATGLYYYGARYYDPALSRFITADTVYDAGPQGLNRYSYALNNPIIYRDPTGHLSYADEQGPQVWEDPRPPEEIPITLGPERHAGKRYLGDGMWYDPIAWEAPPGAGADWTYNPDWETTKGSYSPLYRWTGNPDLTTMDLQMAPYATGGCRGVARRNGYIINPGYGHVEMWTTTDDGCPACYYRPANSRWEVVGQYAAEQMVVIGMIGVGAVTMNPSPSPSSASSKEPVGFLPKPKIRGRTPGPTVDPVTGEQVQRFVVDPRGNTMIEPIGGRTIPWGRGGMDTHTLYPNGSAYQRLDYSHGWTPPGHAHGHLPGTGPGIRGTGPSLDIHGNVVPYNTAEAHWTIK